MLVPIQHVTILPLSLLAGRFNLHLISAGYALRRGLLVDLAGLLLYAAWFGALVGYGLPPGERLWFVLGCYVTIGVLHIQLTVSHLATACFHRHEEAAAQFFAFQVQTTRNIETSWYDDWYHGGLQHQIEHHLFPQLPRHNLARAVPHVRALCHKHGLEYRSVPFCAAVRTCLADFRRLAADLISPEDIVGGADH